MMDNVVYRERLLRESVEQELSDFVRACDEDADFILMQQDAFVPMLGSNEIFLLGKAIKYAGLKGKEVRIIPSTQEPH